MQESNSFGETLRSILRWRKTLALTTLVAFILSIVISLLLPVYYKSTEIFYPYSLESLDPKNIITDKTTSLYGSNDDVDRLKQIGQSAQLVSYMISKYQLYQRYNIDTTDKLASFKVSEEFKGNYKIIKNDKGALEVSILDKDPNTAAKMTRDITHFIDSVNLQPIFETNETLLSALRATLQLKQRDLLSLDSLVNSPNSKLHATSNSLSTKTIIESQKAGNLDTKIAERLLSVIALNEKYNQMEKILKSTIKSIHVIEEAVPAVKKAKPVRWLIVVTSTAITFFFSIIIILLLEFYKNNIRDLLKDE